MKKTKKKKLPNTEAVVPHIRGLNQFQAEAVRQVLDGGGLFHPMIVFGPAGTGKTRTLVELTRLILLYSNAQILVSAPSNTAADILALAIRQAVREMDIVICRWNALRRLDKMVPADIQNISKDKRKK